MSSTLVETPLRTPEDEIAAARIAISEGRASDAAVRLAASIEKNSASHALAYWLAAALGAMGDRERQRAALKKAQFLHALQIIARAGGDVARMQIDPAYAEQVGNVFYSQDHVAVASVAYGCVAANAKPPIVALAHYGLSLMHQGWAEEAATAFRRAYDLYPTYPRALSFLLYALFYVDDGVNRHAAQAKSWRQALGAVKPAAPKGFSNAPLDARRLRIGYVLPNLGFQSRQFLAPVLEHHDRARTEVHIYLRDFDPTAEQPAEYVHPIGDLNDDQAAALIREHQIDVLVDIWGHTSGGRLSVFARKPAPVQVSWLNYLQTTGAPEIDYVIHPDCIAAPDDQEQFVEKIWRIDGVIAPFRPDERPAPTPTPALANGFVTFASYVHSSRLSEETIAGWSRILRRVPDSKLVLRYTYYVDEVLRHALLSRFAAHGVEPERILFRGKLAQPAYYESYAEIDIALDPSPCPGGTTSCDAVANGVPVLTLAGADYFSRIGLAVNVPLGLDELITWSWDEYVDRAVALAADFAALDALRKRVRIAFDASGRRDEEGFTRRLEDTFAEMFNIWRAEQEQKAA